MGLGDSGNKGRLQRSGVVAGCDPTLKGRKQMYRVYLDRILYGSFYSSCPTVPSAPSGLQGLSGSNLIAFQVLDIHSLMLLECTSHT